MNPGPRPWTRDDSHPAGLDGAHGQSMRDGGIAGFTTDTRPGNAQHAVTAGATTFV